MVGNDIPRIVREWASRGYDPVLERLELLSEIVFEAPSDLIDFGEWCGGLARTLALDWYAFSSTIFFSTVLFGVYFGLGFLHVFVRGMTVRYPLVVVEEQLTLFTVTILLGVGAVYTVRTWSRIRSLLQSPLNSSEAHYDTAGIDDNKPPASADISREQKYRYGFWGAVLHLSTMSTIIELENRGHSLQDLSFPISYPSALSDVVGELPTHWVISRGREFLGDPTLGEWIGLALVFFIPAGLFAFAAQVHIAQIKDKDKLSRVRGALVSLWTAIVIFYFLGA